MKKPLKKRLPYTICAGEIYFLCDSERRFVKIGRTNNVKQRVESLKSKNSGFELELIASITSPDQVVYEHIIHNLFLAERISVRDHSQREWYYYRGAVKEFVDMVLKDGINAAVDHVFANTPIKRRDSEAWRRVCIKNVEYIQESPAGFRLKT